MTTPDATEVDVDALSPAACTPGTGSRWIATSRVLHQRTESLFNTAR